MYHKSVKPKKFLGQHFLKDLDIARRIADTVDACPDVPVLEVGPGMGVLTQFLCQKPINVFCNNTCAHIVLIHSAALLSGEFLPQIGESDKAACALHRARCTYPPFLSLYAPADRQPRKNRSHSGSSLLRKSFLLCETHILLLACLGEPCP